MIEKQRVKEVVDALLAEEYIIELFEGEMEQAEDEFYEIVHNTGFSLNEAKEYYMATYKK